MTNAIVTLEILSMLCRRGFHITEEQIATGLEQTRLLARFELLSVSPTIIVDSSYTLDSIHAVCKAIGELRDRIGSCISLCAPDKTVASLALRALEEQNCTTQETILYMENEEASQHLCFNSHKSASKYIVQHMSLDSVWLVLGHHALTVPIREELLKQLDM